MAVTLHNKLSLVSITPEMHQQTCGYWYLVHSNHASFTAFASRSCLYKWLDERGLDIDDSKLAPEGEYSYQPIHGQFRENVTMDEQAFSNLPNVLFETRQMSNGQYTLARVTRDENGVRTVHTLNPNVRTRVVFPYFESDAIYNGRVTPEQAPDLDASLERIGRRP